MVSFFLTIELLFSFCFGTLPQDIYLRLKRFLVCFKVEAKWYT